MRKVILVALICVVLTSCTGNKGHIGGTRMIKADTGSVSAFWLVVFIHFADFGGVAYCFANAFFKPQNFVAKTFDLFD